MSTTTFVAESVIRRDKLNDTHQINHQLKSSEISNANLILEIQDNQNFSNNLDLDNKYLVDCYQPHEVYSNKNNNNNVNNINSKIDQYDQSSDSDQMLSIVLYLLPVVASRSKMFSNIASLIQDMLLVQDQSDQTTQAIAKQFAVNQNADDVKAHEAEVKAARRSGIMALIFGFIQMIIAVYTIITSLAVAVATGGIGAAVAVVGVVAGIMALADGFTKAFSGALLTADPEGQHFDKNKLQTNITQGIFFIFGENSGLLAQIGSLAMCLLGGVSSIASGALAIAGLVVRAATMVVTQILKVIALAALQITNSTLTIAGTIYSIVKQIQHSLEKSDDTQSTTNKIDYLSSLSMGLFAFLLMLAYQSTGLQKMLDDKYGDTFQLIDLIMSQLIYGIVAMYSSYKINKSMESSEVKQSINEYLANSKSSILTSLKKAFNSENLSNEEVSSKIMSFFMQAISKIDLLRINQNITSGAFNINTQANQLEITEIVTETNILRSLLDQLVKRIQPNQDLNNSSIREHLTKIFQDLVDGNNQYVKHLSQILDLQIATV